MSMAILAGTEKIFDEWLGILGSAIGADPQYQHPTTLNRLATNPFRARSFNLVQRMLDLVQIKVNNGLGNPGQTNWIFRQVPDMAEGNGAEVTLERTLINNLPVNGPRTWGNMTPVASGVCIPAADRRMAVDLVEVENSTVTLIELKVITNTPLFAAVEILGYGLCYMIARACPRLFGCSPDLPLFNGKRHLKLRVLAPRPYYYREDIHIEWLSNLEARINQDLKGLDLPFRFDDVGYDIDFGFEAFPQEFNWEGNREHHQEAVQAFLNRTSPF